jgi:hypothetical protein
MIKILITAECFGYGPIITGLNVAKELIKNHDVELNFIGTGVALEQAKMSGYFKNIKECKTFDTDELKNIKEDIMKSDVMLSCENIPGAKYARYLGHKHVFYIDNLMWMWDELHDGLDNLTGYIISETLPCKDNFEKIGKNIENPIFVGPLRDYVPVINNVTEKKLIINIGGAEAFIIDSGFLVKFYNKLLSQILKDKNILDRFEKIIVCGGGTIINNIKIPNLENKISIKVLSNKDYLKELDTASHLIMASGLGNFYESLMRNKNIMYLPPVNYSQLLQLVHYKNMDFGFSILNWDDFSFYDDVKGGLNENVGVEKVIENVEKYINDNGDAILSDKLENFLAIDQSEYFNKRLNYAGNIGNDSNKKVADLIIEKFRGQI